MKKSFLLAVAAICLLTGVAAASAAAPPDVEIPIVVNVNVSVPGSYFFKFELIDEAGAPVWSEEMDTAGEKRKLTTRKLTHLLGSLWRENDVLNDPLDPALFAQQLWLRVLVRKGGGWTACKEITKLAVVPYAAWSAASEAAGAETITTLMLQDGAVTLEKLGFTCPQGQTLAYTAAGWACAPGFHCQEGDFLYCYHAAMSSANVGLCRPGTRLCNEAGTGFLATCAGEVLPAPEICDGNDNDCDGAVDEDPPDGALRYPDEDGDGYGVETGARTFCAPFPGGWAPVAGDCAAQDPGVHPGAREICNDLDDDCNGQVDDDCVLPGVCTADELSLVAACLDQCAAENPGVLPQCMTQCIGGGATPECLSGLGDLLICGMSSGCCSLTGCGSESFGCFQNQCPTEWALITSRTPECQHGQSEPCGHAAVGICRPGVRACASGLWTGCTGGVDPANEICRGGGQDGLDNDCDGQTDEADVELCDGQDNNCNGLVDDGCHLPTDCNSAGDVAAFAACMAEPDPACAVAPALSSGCRDSGLTGDLRDCMEGLCFGGPDYDPGCLTDAALCAGAYEEAFVGPLPQCAFGETRACGAPPELDNIGICRVGTQGCVNGDWGECVGGVPPAESEICANGEDDDCDGRTDTTVFYLDSDQDWYGVGAPVPWEGGCWSGLEPPPGWSWNNLDCDDERSDVNPDMRDEACDGVDNDCSPLTLDSPPDGDGDGVTRCGGDCDDADPAIKPGAAEVCDNGIDENCNGLVDEGCAPPPAVCGNGACESLAGENSENCEPDCGFCSPEEQIECYTGPPGTLGVGACASGWMTCLGPGAWGPCAGEMPPQAEVCDGTDNDCNGQIDEGC